MLLYTSRRTFDNIAILKTRTYPYPSSGVSCNYRLYRKQKKRYHYTVKHTIEYELSY